MEILDIVKQLRATSSRLEKEEILKQHSLNNEWRHYLNQVYNPFIVHGKSGEPNGDLDDLVNLMLLRNLKAGITAATINKIYGKGFIPIFQPMKAGEIGKKFSLDDVVFPCIVQYKYDGFLTHSMVRDGEVIHYTSSGHIWQHEDNKGLESMPPGVYISEMLGGGTEGKLGDRKHAAVQTTFRTNTAKGVKNTLPYELKIFDYIPLRDFHSGKTLVPYIQRLKTLPQHVPTYQADSRENLLKYHRTAIEKGYEGLVIKSVDMLWESSTRRRPHFMKFKVRKTGDFYVKEEIPGEGKYNGMTGSLLLCDANGCECGMVGSGLSDEDRQNVGSFVGKVVEIEYEQIHEGTLIQPVFLHLRHDKSQKDCDSI